MKTFEVRFVEVFRVEAENEDEAYNLALAAQAGEAAGDVAEYLHGDDTVTEV